MYVCMWMHKCLCVCENVCGFVSVCYIDNLRHDHTLLISFEQEPQNFRQGTTKRSKKIWKGSPFVQIYVVQLLKLSHLMETHDTTLETGFQHLNNHFILLILPKVWWKKTWGYQNYGTKSRKVKVGNMHHFLLCYLCLKSLFALMGKFLGITGIEKVFLKQK